MQFFQRWCIWPPKRLWLQHRARSSSTINSFEPRVNKMQTTKTAQSLDVNGPEKYFVNSEHVELCFTPEQGRFMRSRKAIKSGEIVLTVEPYAITVAEEFKTYGCFNCMQFDLNDQQLFKCGNCNNVWYCSAKCQEEAAEWHAPICTALKSLIKVTHVDEWTKSTVRLLLQMYLRKYVEENKVIIGQPFNNNTDETENLSESIVNTISQISIEGNTANNTTTSNMDVNNNNGNDVHINNSINGEGKQKESGSSDIYEMSWKDVAVLISNRSLFSKSNMTYFNDLRRILLNVTHKAQLKLESTENFIETMCQLIQNGFGVRKYGNYCFGYGIYPVASYFNHSCWPNLLFDQRGKLMHFIALHDIPEKTELNISYIPLKEPAAFRQKKLFADYHFKCLCPGCRPKPKKEINTSSEKKNVEITDTNTIGENESSEELFIGQKRKKKKRSRINNNNSGNNRHHFTPNTNTNDDNTHDNNNNENNNGSNTNNERRYLDISLWSGKTAQEESEIDEFQREYVCQSFECEGKGLIYKTQHGQRLCNLCLQSPDVSNKIKN